MRYRLSAVALVLTTGCLMVAGCGGRSIGGAGSAANGVVAGVASAAPASPSPPLVTSPDPSTSPTIAPAPADTTAAVESESGSEPTTESETEPSVSDSAEAATGPLCELFTTAEVKLLLGTDVQAPHDAAGGTGCQWDGSGGVDATYLQIQVIDDPSYYVEQSFADGFDTVKGIGTAAFVVPELGGWAAHAVTDEATFAIAVNGGTASKESATELLKQLVDRY